MKRHFAIFVTLGVLALLPGFTSAQADEVGVSGLQLAANKKLVLDFWRIVIEAGDTDDIGQYVAPDLIQHTPHMAGGSQGLVDLIHKFEAEQGRGRRPVEAAFRNPPEFVLADGDLVQLVFAHTTPESGDPTKSYQSYTFDLYRVSNGKIVEHWDATKPAR